MKNIYFLLKFYYLFKKGRYIEALAIYPLDSNNLINIKKNSYYQLGMFKSVLSLNSCEKIRYSYADFLSLVALGDRDEVDIFLANNYFHKKKNKKLSVALLPYYPELASFFLPAAASDSLKIAIWMRLGQLDRARIYIEDLNLNDTKDPELFLFWINLFKPKPLIGVGFVNLFLKTYGLSEVSLRNGSEPINAMNLHSLVDGENIKGPLVSIIVTVYNCAHRIKYTIESLLAQTYDNFEIIIVDDSSEDNLEEVINEFSCIDNRINYLRLPVNVGTYVAKSIGLNFTKGEFVICHDADDWAHPQKIALQMAPLVKNENLVFTVSNLVRINDDGIFYSRAIYPLTRINPSSVLFRKSAVCAHTGFWDLVRTGADSEFLARLNLVFGKHRMKRIAKPLSFCAHRPKSLMTSSETGYDVNGISGMRLDYWEAFSKWHIEMLRKKNIPKMKNDNLDYRNFDAPVENLVPVKLIIECMNFFNMKTI